LHIRADGQESGDNHAIPPGKSDQRNGGDVAGIGPRCEGGATSHAQVDVASHPGRVGDDDAAIRAGDLPLRPCIRRSANRNPGAAKSRQRGQVGIGSLRPDGRPHRRRVRVIEDRLRKGADRGRSKPDDDEHVGRQVIDHIVNRFGHNIISRHRRQRAACHLAQRLRAPAVHVQGRGPGVVPIRAEGEPQPVGIGRDALVAGDGVSVPGPRRDDAGPVQLPLLAVRHGGTKGIVHQPGLHAFGDVHAADSGVAASRG